MSDEMTAEDGHIRVHGARLHNLRDVDVCFPRNRLVAITGISGSGKSSLAFGTVHGEAQRRFFESVAPFARRLISSAVDPRVRHIAGLPPAVALEQRRATTSSRSSVGTITATSNTLRMLWSRCGDYPAEAAPMDSDHFSANTAVGACPECSGLGTVHRPTEQTMVPDPSKSIAEKAIASWPGAWLGKNYRDILATLGYDVTRPWKDLPQEDRDWILFTRDEPVVTVYAERDPDRINRPYQGKYASAERILMRTLAESKSARQRDRALCFVVTTACTVCHGRRLNPQALAVTWRGLAIDEASGTPVDELLPHLVARRSELPAEPGQEARLDAEALLLDDLVARLSVLVELGLGHLALGRPTPTVSAGELQRLRLATLLRSGLFGVVYVLDEPSAGLHPRDAEPLLRVLRGLVDAGNSVVLVEHDMELVAAADWVVDVGPGAGQEGGRILYSGELDGLERVADSVTARYLHRPVHAESIRTVEPRRPAGELCVSGIELHNLHDLDARIPLAVFTVVMGVSGSGKSSLLSALDEAMGRTLERVGDPSENGDDQAVDDDPIIREVELTGTSAPKRLVRITQKPIGRTPRSNLATYTGLFDHVRRRFAATDDATRAGFGPGRFSFNRPEGRCATCQGEGQVAVELLFMPGTYSACPTCAGARYDEHTLSVRWQGLTIADVLALPVSDALLVFADDRPVRRSLEALDALGLGYLALGQPATELSGGEAQRIKLASELQKERRGSTLYLLDEPTSGLHPHDVHRLLRQLHELVDSGHTVVVVEHDQAAITTADWLIELGPGAGERGGRVVSTGRRRARSDGGGEESSNEDRSSWGNP